MAREKKKGRLGAFVAGLVVMAAAALGIGEFGLGNFEGGLVSDMFAPAEEVINDTVKDVLYDAEVMVVDNVITLDGKEVTLDELKSELADSAGDRVLLIDGGATVAAWQEVLDALNELDVIVETQ
ncbi:MAG: hypothetical protein JXN65_09985 [Clostridia bacterium]|nr:hypothetical protein [Clostridia bacterium]